METGNGAPQPERMPCRAIEFLIRPFKARSSTETGQYIRRYVSELSGVSTKWIHEPQLMSQDEQDRARCRIGVEYPSPIVDHRQARQEYLDLGKHPVAP